MKVPILSDLHIEFQDFEPPVVDADVVVLGGRYRLGKARSGLGGAVRVLSVYMAVTIGRENA